MELDKVSDIIIAVQARMSSQRLPGKVLQLIQSKPMLAWVIQQLKQTDLAEHIVVATSNDQSDDAIAIYCRQQQWPVFRGSLNNVAQRFSDLANSVHAKAFIRICADSPLIDPLLVNQALNLFKSGDYDIVTNVFPRSFPKGQSVEVISVAALNAHLRYFDSAEQEHVCQYFYKNSSLFRIGNFSAEEAIDYVQMSVDTENDMAEMIQIIQHVQGQIPQWRDCLTLLRQHQEMSRC